MVRVRDAPQRPITRSEPKQIPPSYATRSKAKRPFQSAVGDSSGSGLKTLEPPLKRKTQRDAKTHAGGSLKINNGAAQESSNSKAHEQSSRVVKRKSRSHRPPPPLEKTETKQINENTCAEVALQNDVVLEWLFSCMDRSDLLNARLVNKQWEYAGAKELRRRKFTMELLFDADRKRPKNAFYNICRVMTECQTPLFLLSSLHVEVNSRDYLGCSGIKNIFNAVGNHLKDLTLFVDYSGKTTTFQKSPLMTHLQHLISLVPHLERLEVHFQVPSHWRDQLQILGSSENHQNDSKEFLLPKLKTFIITGAAPAKFFVDVIKGAVNLEYVGGDFSHNFSASIKYFLGPDGSSKIHQLKDLRLLLHHKYTSEWEVADFEIMETFLKKYKNLQLETFGIAYQMLWKSVSSRMQNVINQILEENSGTLKKLIIQPLREFKDIAIPRLPKLQEIWFRCRRSKKSERSEDSFNFLPKGFDMNDRFPNVSSLVFLNCKENLLRLYICQLEISTPVESVRHILVKVAPMSKIEERRPRWFGSAPSGPSFRARDPQPSEFHNFFPNLVSLTYEHTSKI